MTVGQQYEQFISVVTVYRNKKGKLMPYETKNNDLFEVKECFNDKTQWNSTQTMITPKGRETFCLLIQGV